MIYSYSRINDWRNCPRQFHEVHVRKTFKKTFGPAAEKGIKLHRQVEETSSDGDFTRLDDKITKKTRDLLMFFRVQGAEAEKSLAVTTEGTEVDFFASNPAPWLRGKLDLYLPRKDKAIIMDWKTGNPQNHKDDLQAKVYAAMLASRFLEVYCVFYFILHDVEFSYTVNTAEAREEVGNIIDVIDRDIEAVPTPSGLCGYCPVTTCDYQKVPF